MCINKSNGGDNGDGWWDVISGVHELTQDDTATDLPNGFDIWERFVAERTNP